MTKQWVEMDFGSVGLDFSRLSCSDREVGFDPDRSQLRFHQQTGSVDIFQTVLNSKAIRRDEAKGRLNLSDYI